jgi:hypothetical protein
MFAENQFIDYWMYHQAVVRKVGTTALTFAEKKYAYITNSLFFSETVI